MAADMVMRACQDGQATLAINLLKHLTSPSSAGGAGTRNLIFSPLSIHAALSLAAAGARGETLGEFLAVLGAPSLDALAAHAGATAAHALADRSASGGPCVAFACGAWSDASRPLRPAYRDAVVKSFKATTASLDFLNNPAKASDEINKWVAEVTRNLITSIVDSESVEDTVVMLANAIYFKGKWLEAFDVADTTDGEFHRLDGSAVEVPFMRSSKGQPIACHDGFKVLKLPYKMKEDKADDSSEEHGSPDSSESEPPCKKQKPASPEKENDNNCGHETELELEPPKFSMCFFLPDKRDGLGDLVGRITSDKGFLFEHLPKQYVAVVEFRLPRFNLSFLCSVSSALVKLGLRLPFIEGEADLTGMVEDSDTGEDMYVRGVFHKAVVEVNEEGTEAAAVTWLEEEDDSDVDEEKPKVDFVADHPFAFFIVEESSGAVVFAGQVTDPSRE